MCVCISKLIFKWLFINNSKSINLVFKKIILNSFTKYIEYIKGKYFSLSWHNAKTDNICGATMYKFNEVSSATWLPEILCVNLEKKKVLIFFIEMIVLN